MSLNLDELITWPGKAASSEPSPGETRNQKNPESVIPSLSLSVSRRLELLPKRSSSLFSPPQPTSRGNPAKETMKVQSNPLN